MDNDWLVIKSDSSPIPAQNPENCRQLLRSWVPVSAESDIKRKATKSLYRYVCLPKSLLNTWKLCAGWIVIHQPSLRSIKRKAKPVQNVEKKEKGRISDLCLPSPTTACCETPQGLWEPMLSARRESSDPSSLDTSHKWAVENTPSHCSCLLWWEFDHGDQAPCLYVGEGWLLST